MSILSKAYLIVLILELFTMEIFIMLPLRVDGMDIIFLFGRVKIFLTGLKKDGRF